MFTADFIGQALRCGGDIDSLLCVAWVGVGTVDFSGDAVLAYRGVGGDLALRAGADAQSGFQAALAAADQYQRDDLSVQTG